LLLHGLKDEILEFACSAYSLLQENVEPELKMALKIYDTYQLRGMSLSGHSHRIQRTYLSPNGLVLASYSQEFVNSYGLEATVKLWDVKTGSLKTTFKCGSVGAINFDINPNLHNVAVGSRPIELRSVETSTIETTLTIPSSDSITNFAFSLNGQFLAGRKYTDAYNNQEATYIWDVRSGLLKTTIHTGNTGNTNNPIALSPNGSLLAIVPNRYVPDERFARNDTIQLWCTNTGKLKTTLHTRSHQRINEIVFSPDGQFLGVNRSNNELDILNVETGAANHCYIKLPGGFLAFSPDGQSIATVIGGKGIDIWDVITGTRKISFFEYPRNISSLAFSPNGNIVASSSIGNTVQVWTLELSSLNRFDPVALFHSYLDIKQSNSTLYSAIQALNTGKQEEKESAFSQLKSREEPAIQATLCSYINAQPLSEFEVNQSRHSPERNIYIYKWLKYFLATNQLEKAQEETENILRQEVGSIDVKAITDTSKIPCLSVIYGLWQTYAKINIPANFLRDIEMNIEYLKSEQKRLREEKWDQENLGFGAHLRDS
jgi:WD40 repeat protein